MAELLERFAAARSEGRALFLPYLTAGLPDPVAAPSVFAAMADAGADGFEVGIPYADPLMDGPVIQEAARRALEGGTDVDTALRVMEAAARTTGKPTIVMTYVNPVLRAGIDGFVDRIAAAGAQGLIVADLPLDEAEPFLDAARRRGIAMALFAAPTTTDERLRRLGALRPGFVYGIADLGVTGERAGASSRAAQLAARVREVTDAPLVLGVGITTPADVAAAAQVADGVIVGSAIVRRVLDAEPGTEAAIAAAAVASYVPACRRP